MARRRPVRRATAAILPSLVLLVLAGAPVSAAGNSRLRALIINPVPGWTRVPTATSEKQLQTKLNKDPSGNTVEIAVDGWESPNATAAAVVVLVAGPNAPVSLRNILRSEVDDIAKSLCQGVTAASNDPLASVPAGRVIVCLPAANGDVVVAASISRGNVFGIVASTLLNSAQIARAATKQYDALPTNFGSTSKSFFLTSTGGIVIDVVFWLLVAAGITVALVRRHRRSTVSKSSPLPPP